MPNEKYIKSVYLKEHDSSSSAQLRYKAVVTVELDSKTFNKLKRRREIGYVVAAVNDEFYKDFDFPAYNPRVDHSKRASKGIKTVIFTYYSNDAELFKRLGLPIHPWGAVEFGAVVKVNPKQIESIETQGANALAKVYHFTRAK